MAASKPAPRLTANLRSVGKVIHYYDKIGVGIVKLDAPLSVGDKVFFRRGEEEFAEEVSSMQVDHQPITAANRGQIIGLKVSRKIKEGAKVLKA